VRDQRQDVHVIYKGVVQDPAERSLINDVDGHWLEYRNEEFYHVWCTTTPATYTRTGLWTIDLFTVRIL
jgi:hypothetical protein